MVPSIELYQLMRTKTEIKTTMTCGNLENEYLYSGVLYPGKFFYYTTTINVVNAERECGKNYCK